MLTKEESGYILPKLEDFLNTASGIAFCLVMRDSSGGLQIYPRINQPCWGELRKYKSTHPSDCTQPEDRRPGDLSHPFPDGTPEALAVHKQLQNDRDKFIWTDHSPWIRGFGGVQNIIMHRRGIILKDLAIDPTVLVNLLKNTSCRTETAYFNKIAAKLGAMKALIPSIFTGVEHYYYYSSFPAPDTYTNSMSINVKNIVEQNPLDLTGGTLRDRYDYNRKNLANIFALPEKEGGLNLCKMYGERGIEYRSLSNIIPLTEDILAEQTEKFDIKWR